MRSVILAFTLLLFFFFSCTPKERLPSDSSGRELSMKPSKKKDATGKETPKPPPPPPVIEEVPEGEIELEPPRTSEPPPSPKAEGMGERSREIKDIKVVFEPETYEEKIIVTYADEDDAAPSRETPAKDTGKEGKAALVEEVTPGAGQVTAGEWNELDHWDIWNDELEYPERVEMETYWKCFPRERYQFRLTNSEYQPVADATVELRRGKEVVWTARTDNDGKAELWAGFWEEEEKEGRFDIVAKYQDEEYELGLLQQYEAGVNHLKIPVICAPPEAVDIFFTVDATGSMSDEIHYLKAELQDVINRVKKENAGLDYRLGSLFYRDEGDAYLTRASDISGNIEQTIQFIKSNGADGGGDYPEAVHTALEESIEKMSWSSEARARLLFLLLDAPPHYEEEVLGSLKESMAEAAARGIKIIPISASGIDRPTEYLLKFMSMATNGTYVFITDHSGIGNPHLEPSAKDYEVEYLNDLTYRLITKYSSNRCDAEDRWMGGQDNPGQLALRQSVNLYPNPATDFVNLQLSQAVDGVSILDAGGKTLKELGAWQSGNSRIKLAEFPAGSYLIKITKGDVIITEKIVIARG